MARLVRFLIYVAALVAIGVVLYAYVGDLRPERHALEIPVTLDAR